ncbi:PIN domain-containing protein [candidate division KSB3 bacterium]|uniref:PIN domain-containing protein n=1 Tax=candidate division KSB3 bacterium TaxID=2044937 RepID=A0A9D5JSN0_9BACT|nr:PIN domain-containing protein [candidate division KSB3 bacterium]MBD3323468.1 PIN domain-containing protein [candidate division KSB3 bacterium]
MIVLDTHIWVWWVDGNMRLPDLYAYIQTHESSGLGVSVMSCWEVAKLVEYQRLRLDRPVEDWIHGALQYPGIRLLELTPRIIVESTQLPGAFHRDPADQLIVATARIFDCPLVTLDDKIRAYPHVETRP